MMCAPRSFRLSSAHWDGPIHSLPLHHAILEAIRKRDPEAAYAAMRRLLQGAAQDVRRALAEKRPKLPKRRAVKERKVVGNAA